ncbi:MAG TPA: TraB/GumN family protein [Paracoccaceae bacterium]|nr:TraB/GumN family protein [Paracoccaceae bacterium]
MFKPLAALATALTFLAAAPATAACTGQNLIAALPEADRAAIAAAAAAHPFAQGNFWRATRGDRVVHLVGTYHMDDPRHDALLRDLTPLVMGATRLLVEAGPEEEAALMAHMARDPALMLAPQGPTLAEALPEAEWQRLADALRDRGIPPFMGSRFRPWYVSVLLAVPPCALAQAADKNGLDARLITTAQVAGVPVLALEPYDTALRVFDLVPQDAQLDMIRSALALEDRAEDQLATLADAYFAEDSRLIWEFLRFTALSLPGATPEKVAAEFAQMDGALMVSRNRAWIPVIEQAAQSGPVVAAFGALHLSGEDGVLALLSRAGWTVDRLSF